MPRYTRTNARQEFQAERKFFEDRGVVFDQATSYLPEEFRQNSDMAMDAQPTLGTDPNAGIPSLLTTYVDPDIYEFLFAPNKAAEAVGEERKGDWTTDTAMFPVVEDTGEVSSYGDYNNNGRAGANSNFPQRQSYHFQVIMSYGDREVARAGLAKLNWVSQINRSAGDLLKRYSNLTYLFGVAQLQNYGLTNDPNLPAALTPAPKANNQGVGWYTPGGTPNATPNEVYNDILAMVNALIVANQGLVDADSAFTLVLGPSPALAFNFVNSFKVNVKALIKDNFPKMKIVTIPQFGVLSASNTQGIAAGNLVQLIADDVEGQKTAFCAYTDKLRSFPLVREMSAYKQKEVSGTWGCIIRMPVGFSQMLGV